MRLLAMLIALLGGIVTASPVNASTEQIITVVLSQRATHYPVAKAMAAWNKSERVEFVIRDTCQYPCVKFTNTLPTRYPNAVGSTVYYNIDGVRGLYWEIRLAPPSDWSERGERAIVCHELGHVLQVSHGPVCMRSYVNSNKPYPGAYNRSLIDTTY